MALKETAASAPNPLAWIVRILVALALPLITFIVLWQVFLFLRDSDAPKWLIAIVAILWGVGGVAVLFILFNWLVEKLPDRWRARIQPFIFVGPALAMLAWFLFVPTIRTFYQSFFDKTTANFVGLDNYKYAFTNSAMLEAFVNNLIWLVFGTGLSVSLGLLIAVLADRSKIRKSCKVADILANGYLFRRRGHHLEVHLRLSTQGQRTDRLAQRDCYRRLWWGSC